MRRKCSRNMDSFLDSTSSFVISVLFLKEKKTLTQNFFVISVNFFCKGKIKIFLFSI